MLEIILSLFLVRIMLGAEELFGLPIIGIFLLMAFFLWCCSFVLHMSVLMTFSRPLGKLAIWSRRAFSFPKLSGGGSFGWRVVLDSFSSLGLRPRYLFLYDTVDRMRGVLANGKLKYNGGRGA